MSALVCVTGGRGAPGATTLALAMAMSSDHAVTLIDADPDGGDLAAMLGRSSSPGLVSLAAAVRHRFAGAELERHVQAVHHGIGLLAAPSSPEQVGASLTGLGRAFAEAVATTPSIADLGRWRPGSPTDQLLRTADTVVLVVHPTVSGVAHARFLFEDLSTRCSNVVVACRGERPYDSSEVAEAIGCVRAIPVPVDRVGASMLCAATKDRWLRRTPLLRSARVLLDSLSSLGEVAS